MMAAIALEAQRLIGAHAANYGPAGGMDGVGAHVTISINVRP